MGMFILGFLLGFFTASFIFLSETINQYIKKLYQNVVYWFLTFKV